MSREMVNSGIPWIGKIPKGWKVSRLKNLATDKDSLIIDGDWIESNVIEASGIRYLTTGNVGDGVFKEQGQGYISRETFDALNCTMVYAGDLVFSRLNYPMGRSCIIPDTYERCVVAVDNVIFRPNKDVSKRFLMYVSMCTGFQNENALIARGATMQRMSRSQLVRVFVPIPDTVTQQKIASFLDRKCAEIDEMIALQEKIVEELKAYKQSVITEAVTKGLNPDAPMKDSGIEWIGEIPEHWSLYRLKYLCSIQTGDKDTQDAVQDGQYPFYVRSPRVEKSNNYSFEGEGILMAGDGAGAGRVFHHVYGKYAVHQRVYRMYNIQNIIQSDYLFYYISNLFCKVMDMGSAQSTVPSVRLPMLTNFATCIPPMVEQEAIAEYLNTKCTEIDNLISIKLSKIDSLKEYKKSIIYEYVTGKKEVI